MIINILGTQINILNYLLIMSVSSLAVLAMFLFIFDKYSRKVLFRFWCTLLSLVLINISFFILFLSLASSFLKFNIGSFDAAYVVFIIILTVVINLSLVMRIKAIFPKAKKSGDLYSVSTIEFYDNRNKSLNLLAVSSLIIIPIYMVGNEFMKGLLISLFLTVFISCLSSIFLFSILLKTFDKIFK